MKKHSHDLLNPQQRGFSFGGFRLVPDGTLWHGDQMVHLPPKELAALRFLITSAGQIVTPTQLKQELWGDVHVSPDSVPKCISSLRAKLEPEECIQTVYKRGYRFSVEVRREGVPSQGALPRLAVVPFATEFTVPEYLGQAIAEEAISRLTSLRRQVVSVVARDSVFGLAQQKFSALKIGETLKADLVLAGTLRAVGSLFRLRAEMIRVEDGIQIWVEDLLVPQNSIANLEAELVQRLLTRLNGGGLSIFASATSTAELRQTQQQKDAYEIFLHAHYEGQTLQRHRMQDSLRNLTRAVELDPTLMAAKLEIVRLCVAQCFFGFMPASQSAEQVRRTTLSIPGFPEGAESILPAVAWINFHVDHDLAGALEALSACSHLPRDPWTQRLLILFDLSRHRFDEAITLLRAALVEDPFALWLHSRMAWALHLAGRAAESVAQIRRAFTLFPNNEVIAFLGASILAYNGETAQALQLVEGFTQHEPYLDLATSVHAYVLASAGRKNEARAILERLQWLSRERFVISSFTPAAHVALGDHTTALRDLRAAEEARCPWFFQMLADPCLKPLRAYPEFIRMKAILTEMEEEAAQSEEELEYG